MKRKFSYFIGEINRRLLAIRKPIRKYIVISTIASILGALSHMGLMGFGVLWLLAAAGMCGGMGVYAALTVSCAILIAVCRYLETVLESRENQEWESLPYCGFYCASTRRQKGRF